MKQRILGGVVGLGIAVIIFRSLILPILFTIDLDNWEQVESIWFWVIVLLGAIIGGYMGRDKSSFILFKRAMIGLAVGAFVFQALTFPIVLLLDLDWEMMDVAFWLIPFIGASLGGIVGGYIGNSTLSLAVFKNITASITFLSAVIFGVLAMDIAPAIYGVAFIGVGNSVPAILAWICSGLAFILGGLAGAAIGVLIARIYLWVNNIYDMRRQAQ